MVAMISTLIGGLGLLLIGMHMMTDGLKLASGNALRDILALWTKSRLRGLLSGYLITAIVQSSSAVTVATIGFANAGMLTLERAIWVIYGSNVGTTMTAWIVALVGFKLNIDALALPLVGLGVFLQFTGKGRRRGFIGQSLVGFGLLFLGISFLKAAFDNLGADVTLPAVENLTLLWIIAYVMIGVVMTTLMQSSSAVIVIALSAAESGVVPLNAAAAVVIGASLGTTTTALLAIIGATATAKRVAVSHVVFNLVTASVSVFILGPMLWLVQWLEMSFQAEPTPSLTLAIFHSLFKLFGVLLMWPLSPPLVRFLEKRFTTQEDTVSRPKYLDKTVLALPFIALDAMALEVSRINHHSIAVFRQSIALHPARQKGMNEVTVVRQLSNAVGHYAAALNQTPLTPFLSETREKLLESTQQYLLLVDIADDINQMRSNLTQALPAPVSDALFSYHDVITRHLQANDLQTYPPQEDGSESYAEVERSYRQLKNTILAQAAQGSLDMDETDRLLQLANQAKRGCRQLMKATVRLLGVRESLHRDREDKVV